MYALFKRHLTLQSVLLGGLLLLLLGLSGCNYQSKKRSHTLKIYNWADYIDESLIPEFEQWYKEQTGEEVHVVMQLFDINEMALAKIERGKEDFDLVCPSDYIIERMLKKDLLLPIDTSFGTTPNYLHNISPYIVQTFDDLSTPTHRMSDYAVGYMWGTLGILYNPKFVTRDEALSWSTLWNPKFKGKIFMKDAIRDVYSLTMIEYYAPQIARGEISLVDAMNDESDEAIAIAEQRLKAVKKNVAGWESDFGKELMCREAAYMNVNWSGDAVWAIEEAAQVGITLDYTVPVEGSNVWFDGWVIPKYAKNRRAASYFINFMCRPESAIRNMDEIGYVSVIATPEVLESRIDSTLEAYIDLSYFFGKRADSVQVDPIQYPDRTEIERCAIMHDFEEKTPQLVAVWSRVKGDNLHIGWLILIGTTFGSLLLGHLIRRTRKKRRMERFWQRQAFTPEEEE
ncbi:MAG: ABC transporter substrate-binding protein [Alistipes sp.]|nr:ABC transporter substrate-binding protein [Alistipes sp.]